jgi:hypothetical protein
MTLKSVGFWGVWLVLAAVGCGGSSEGSDNVGGGGTGGTTEPLDDPFGVGGRSCDGNMNFGGDSCVGAFQAVGFFTVPEHITTNLRGDEPIALSIITEYTPNTPLKLAVEDGVALFGAGSSTPIPVTTNWSSPDGWAVVYTLVPSEPLATGWYSVLVPFAAREALGAQYEGFAENPLWIGGHFVELDNGDLRADFGVGSQPVLAHVTIYGEITIKFSEELVAATPPVSVSVGSDPLVCRSLRWSGSGSQLTLSCIEGLAGYADPITIAFEEGLVTAAGVPLRGPDGNTAFVIDVPEESTVQFSAPEAR